MWWLFGRESEKCECEGFYSGKPILVLVINKGARAIVRSRAWEFYEFLISAFSEFFKVQLFFFFCNNTIIFILYYPKNK